MIPKPDARSGFKLDPPHSPDCYLNESSRQEFIVHDGYRHLDKIGRRGGSQMWHFFRCNCANCPGRMLVRWDVLMEFVAHGMREAA